MIPSQRTWARLALLPTHVLTEALGIDEAEATELRLEMALAALAAADMAAPDVARTGPARPRPRYAPPPAAIGVSDDEPPAEARAAQAVAAARAARGAEPQPPGEAVFYVGVNGRYAGPMRADDSRNLTPMLREAACWATREAAQQALDAWAGRPEGAAVLEMPAP